MLYLDSSTVYQKSWESGKVPADGKLPSVILIYKEGPRGGPGKLQTSWFNLSPWRSYGDFPGGH